MRRRAPATLAALADSIASAAFLVVAAAACVACQSAGTGGDAGSVAPDDGGAPPGDAGLFLGGQDAPAGGPCDASTDCPSGLLCLYAVAEGCAAHGVCEELAASSCGGPYCTCRGDTSAACGAYAELPMVAPLHGPPCGVVEDDAGDD
jgi:hypothetical protein